MMSQESFVDVEFGLVGSDLDRNNVAPSLAALKSAWAIALTVPIMFCTYNASSPFATGLNGQLLMLKAGNPMCVC